MTAGSGQDQDNSRPESRGRKRKPCHAGVVIKPESFTYKSSSGVIKTVWELKVTSMETHHTGHFPFTQKHRADASPYEARTLSAIVGPRGTAAGGVVASNAIDFLNISRDVEIGGKQVRNMLNRLWNKAAGEGSDVGASEALVLLALMILDGGVGMSMRIRAPNGMMSPAFSLVRHLDKPTQLVLVPSVYFDEAASKRLGFGANADPSTSSGGSVRVSADGGVAVVDDAVVVAGAGAAAAAAAGVAVGVLAKVAVVAAVAAASESGPLTRLRRQFP